MNLLNGLLGGGGHKGHKGGHGHNPLDINGDGKVNALGILASFFYILMKKNIYF